MPMAQKTLSLSFSCPATGPAPDPLDFTPDGLGTNFTSLSPSLGQLFFIGDGFLDSSAKHSDDPVSHRFIAPPGATRLVLGMPDKPRQNTVYFGAE
jgi:hypothetical protein